MLENFRTRDELYDDALFMRAYIPHKLDNIENYENEDDLEKQGIELNNPFLKIIGKTTDPNIHDKNYGNFCYLKLL